MGERNQLDDWYRCNMKPVFGIIGCGVISDYHLGAIKAVDGTIGFVCDPVFKHNYYFRQFAAKILMLDIETIQPLGMGMCCTMPGKSQFEFVDYVVICSPTHTHQAIIKEALKYDVKVIVEKPHRLPWEPEIDDNRINVVLQLRYLELLEKKADVVVVDMVRGSDYFNSWKGDARLTGGLLFNLFIHYVDLALRLGANFEGKVIRKGKQHRFICYEAGVNYQDILVSKEEMQECYNELYQDILSGKGIKPRDLLYLYWVLERHSEIYGYGANGMEKTLLIKNNLE